MSAMPGAKKLRCVLVLGPVLALSLFNELRPQSSPGEKAKPVPPEVRIRVEVSPKTATVGDPIRLDLDVTAPPNCRVEFKKPDAQAGDFLVREFFPIPNPPPSPKTREPSRSGTAQSGEWPHHRLRIVLAVYRTGKFTLPPIPVKAITFEGREIAASSPPVEIEIRTVLKGKDPGLKDLKKQAEIPEPSRWILWTAIVVAACALCAAAWYLRRKRRTPAIPQAPVQARDLLDSAEEELRNLLAGGLPEAGKEKRFYVALSEIAKKMLEAGYGIHTAERTTSEIMDALNGIAIADPESEGLVESFLNRCDVVKFAKYIPARTEHETIARDALRILEKARKAGAGMNGAL